MNKQQKVEIKRYSFKEKGDCKRFLDTLKRCNVNFTVLEKGVTPEDNKINIVIEYKK